MRREEGDCYEYIRNYYGVPAYIGVRVRHVYRGVPREGVIVTAKHTRQYVHIKWDGATKSDVYHPTDGIEYLVQGRPADAAVGLSSQPA